MEIGLREWLIVGAIIVILLIVIDGWRRMRAQSNSLKIDIDDKLADLGDDCYNPELPLGTARVFKPKDDEVNTSAELNWESENNLEANEAEHENNNMHPQPELSNENTELNSTTTSSSVPDETALEPQENLEQSHLDNQNTRNDEQTALDTTPTDSVNLGFTALDSQTDEPTVISRHSLNDTPDTGQEADTDSAITTEVESSFINDNVAAVSVAKDGFAVPDILKKPLTNNEPLIKEVAQTVLTSSADSTTEIKSDVVVEHIESEKLIEEIGSSTSEPKVSLKDEFDEFIDVSGFDDDNEVDNDILSVGVPASRAQEQPKLAQSEQKIQDESSLGFHETPIPVNESVQEETNQPVEAELSVIEQIANKQTESNSVDDNKKDNLQVEQTVSKQNAYQSSVIEENLEELEQTNAEMVKSSEDSRSSEIELLKARLRELSEEALLDKTPQQLDDERASEPSSATQRTNDLEEQGQKSVSREPASENESVSELNGSNEKAEQPQIVQDQSITSSDDLYTTVIDDDVSLEELAKELTELPEDSIQTSFEKSDYQDKGRAEQDVEGKESTGEVDVNSDDQQISNIAFSATDDEVANEPLAEADPLLDDFSNQQASQQLMSQFEEDLETADKVVANELDMPITEILKNATPLVELESTQTSKDDLDGEIQVDKPVEIQGDPLLDGISLSEQLLSGDDFDDQIEPLDEQEPLQQDTLNESDNLGFTALEQGYEESSDIDKSDKSNAVDEVHQESLFNEMPEVVASNVKKPRKVMTGSGDPDSVLIVTVVAKDHGLDGGGLKQIVEACGMEFGDMDVFHRFEDGADQGAVQFSMANAVKPGTFILDEMDATSTPGVSFFMSMNEPLDPKNALECMLATAETVANNLNGNLLDDDKSVLRPQTKEHYRERVRIHEMNKLRRRAH